MEFKEFLDMMANVFQYHLSHPEVGYWNTSQVNKTFRYQKKKKFLAYQIFII